MRGIETGGGAGPAPKRPRHQSNPVVAARAGGGRNVTRPRVVPSEVRDVKSDADRARAAPYVQQAIDRARTDQFSKTFGAQVAAARKKEKKGGGGGVFGILGTILSPKVAGPVASAVVAPGLTANLLTSGRDSARVGKEMSQNAAKDALNLPAEAVPSVYHLGSQAAHGDVRGVLQSLAQPYIDTYRDPVGALHDHPLNTYLLGAGVKGGFGRGVGDVMRRVPGPTRDLASTARAPRTVPGTALEERRTYSPDVLTKAAQVGVERVQGRRARRLDQRAAASTGDRADELRAKAAKARGEVMRPREIRRRVDERMDANELLRREDRGLAAGAARRTLPKQLRKGDDPTTVLVAQRIIKPTSADLRAYRDELVAEQGSLSHAKLAASKILVRHIDGKLKSGVDWPTVAKAANDYRDATVAGQQRLGAAGILDPAQVERRALMPYAVRNMGAVHDPIEGLVVKSGGKTVPLSNDAIRAHMKAAGVEAPAFVTQAPNQRGAGNFFRSSHEPASVGQGPFTGRATVQGTFDAHPDTLVEGAARAQALVSQQDHFTRTLTEFGRRDGDGKLVTYSSFRAAQQAANNMLHQADGSKRAGAVPMRPVRANPFQGPQAQLDKLVEHADLDHTSQNAVRDALDSALAGDHGNGPWALIPETAAERAREHLKVLGGGGLGKTFQVVSGSFRRTVLASSPRWLFGNTAEGALRAGVARAGPRAYATGRKVQRRLKQIDPEAARELEARATGGGHMAMADRQQIHRAAEQFANTNVAPIARALGTFWRAPGPRNVAAVWHRWTDFVFNSVNAPIERHIQTAMLGQAIRKSPLMEGQTVKLGQRAVEQAARGLRNTNVQAQFARKVDDMYGRYGKLSPAERRMISTVTPFAAWSMSAVNFLYRVMPRDHPVLTSLLASANEATEEWRKEHGLDLFAAGALPGFLQGSIPTKGGGHIRASRYSPTGAAGSITDTLAGLLLPQVSGVQEALQGRDWKGAKLHGPGGRDPNDIDKLMAAGGAFLSSTVPLLAQGARIRSKGSVGAGLKAEVNPFPVVAPTDREVGTGSAGPEDPHVARAFRRAQSAARRRGGDSQALDRAFRRAQRLAAQP